MMLDQDIVAVSPSSTWRVLSKAGLLQKWKQKPSLKVTGFVQPLLPHEHWHVDVDSRKVHRTLQHREAAQRHWLRDTSRQAERLRPRDLQRARQKA